MKLKKTVLHRKCSKNYKKLKKESPTLRSTSFHRLNSSAIILRLFDETKSLFSSIWTKKLKLNSGITPQELQKVNTCVQNSQCICKKKKRHHGVALLLHQWGCVFFYVASDYSTPWESVGSIGAWRSKCVVISYGIPVSALFITPVMTSSTW